ncbi:unnamed protein product [Phytophthora lilii]|uniref:Unnamed protein product n=1 Tax=Phytophthora lilii TaxID=2077276 RepID=A0A9W6XHL7_9STRA|nr:unnamed protein product [Phytophthora lilii]
MASTHVPFRPLKLSPEERQHCQDRAFQLLDRTLRSYDERDGQGDGGHRANAPLHHSNLDNTRWKLLKTQANASAYTERNSSSSVFRDQNLLGGDWENPVVILMAGTVQGDLDEIMLGVEIPDAPSLKVRIEAYTKQPVESQLAAQGSDATTGLRDLGFYRDHDARKWRSHWLRGGDACEASAVSATTGDNLRGKAMYAAIFKQQEPGVVDVFAHTYVEMQGAILDKLLMTYTWKSTLGFWDARELAEMKKLQWCIANWKSERQKELQRASSSAVNVCRQCVDKRSMMKRFNCVGVDERTLCVLCASPTCSKCRVERKLKVVDESSRRLVDKRVLVCRPCLMFVRQLAPTEVARLNHKQRVRQQQASS